LDDYFQMEEAREGGSVLDPRLSPVKLPLFIYGSGKSAAQAFLNPNENSAK
jgi:hypothetical protein